jgi:hypothetical protein
MKHALARVAAATVALTMVLVMAGRPAAADNVDTLIRDLGGHADYKVRLSAAASLTKIGDPRAIPVLIRALQRDREKTVRGAAAVGLGTLVTSATSADLRTAAIAALGKAAGKDKDTFVQRQAKKSYDRLRKLDDAVGPAKVAGIYVDVGPMAAKAGKVSDMKALMRRTVEKTFEKNAAAMATRWPGGKAPSKKDLRGRPAFHVDGTLNELSTQTRGSATIVSCKVNMLIATYPDKSMFGFLNGGASVQASSDAADVELAKQDCVMAVVEDLVIKKIIPTIQAKAGS